MPIAVTLVEPEPELYAKMPSAPPVTSVAATVKFKADDPFRAVIPVPFRPTTLPAAATVVEPVP